MYTLMLTSDDVNKLNEFDRPEGAIVDSFLIDEGLEIKEHDIVFVRTNHEDYEDPSYCYSLDNLYALLEDGDYPLVCSMDLATLMLDSFEEVMIISNQDIPDEFYKDRDSRISRSNGEHRLIGLAVIPDDLRRVSGMLDDMISLEGPFNVKAYSDISYLDITDYRIAFPESFREYEIYAAMAMYSDKIQDMVNMLNIIMNTCGDATGFVKVVSYISGACMASESGSEVHFKFLSTILTTLTGNNSEALDSIMKMVSESINKSIANSGKRK